jgi:uncharacterized protein with HEPN domain
MLDAAEKALRFVKGRTRTDLDNDEMLSLAVVRLLEILGEAARHVTSDLQRSRPDIPWRQIAGTRDRLIHGYDEVDLDIVWTIVSAELRPLVDALAHLLDEGAGPPLQSMAE